MSSVRSCRTIKKDERDERGVTGEVLDDGGGLAAQVLLHEELAWL